MFDSLFVLSPVLLLCELFDLRLLPFFLYLSLFALWLEKARLVGLVFDLWREAFNILLVSETILVSSVHQDDNLFLYFFESGVLSLNWLSDFLGRNSRL